MWFIYTREYHSAIKRNEIVSFAEACIDLEMVIQNEISQSEKQILYNITNMWNLEKWYK